ncbi:MAG TPA: carbonic anhydrase [Actinomycetota bacterium]|jgi:carbonic anhydrase|nr:carbonic anhydrase [Actinomycetota bacterium]
MTAVDEVLDRNRTYAGAFSDGDAPARPTLRLAVLTCIDGRVQPARFLRLGAGEAHVIRNAGGRCTDDALRSLIVSTRLLGTRECMVIHHTDCGMQTFTNEEVRTKLKSETGASADDIDFMPFTDLAASARVDVRTIRGNPLLPDDLDVTAWIYDVRTGTLERVAAD